MQHVFADAELRVERDGGVVAAVRLHEEHVDAAVGSVPLQLGDHRGGDALTAMALVDGEVVDVELRAGLLELGREVTLSWDTSDVWIFPLDSESQEAAADSGKASVSISEGGDHVTRGDNQW